MCKQVNRKNPVLWVSLCVEIFDRQIGCLKQKLAETHRDSICR